MEINKKNQTTYLIGSAIVWASIWIATGVVLAGTPYFGYMLPILLIGTAWTFAIAPAIQVGRRPTADLTPPPPVA